MPGWPSAAHFGLYLVLGALLYRAADGRGGKGDEASSRAPCPLPPSHCPPSSRGQLSVLLLALAAGAVYAATDELHQHFVPSRQADVWDWLVDLAGVLAGALAALAATRRRGKI